MNFVSAPILFVTSSQKRLLRSETSKNLLFPLPTKTFIFWPPNFSERVRFLMGRLLEKLTFYKKARYEYSLR